MPSKAARIERFPAGLDGVTVQSHGCKLLGGIYRAAGAGPRPTAILLHGLPGVEKNLDIAYALRDAGWNCLYMHYRGSWGSEGVFTLAGRHDDLLAFTGWLQQQNYVDPDRLALVGHSAGGYLTLMAGAVDSRFKVMVALCPLLSSQRAPLTSQDFEEWAGMLAGINGPELQAQYAALPPVESVAERLRNRPVLLLTGRQDTYFPPDHYPPFADAVPTIEWKEFEDGDHGFSLCRQEVVRFSVKWLVSQLGQ
jgi:uncharacterized protein